MRAINLDRELAAITSTWAPRVIAQLNDYEFKLTKLEGDFHWHRHQATDEAFLVLDGELTIELRDDEVHLAAGELYVVPAGVEHRPRAAQLCQVMLIEPCGVLAAGDAETS